MGVSRFSISGPGGSGSMSEAINWVRIPRAGSAEGAGGLERTRPKPARGIREMGGELGSDPNAESEEKF